MFTVPPVPQMVPQKRGKRRAGRHASDVTPEPLEARRFLTVATIFAENFDGLAFGPNREEAAVGTNVWTNVPPAGWVKDDTGVPGWDQPAANNGREEWIGWTFAQKDWWVTAAGDQTRSLFTDASGGVMIADPDEWDDSSHFKSLFNSFLKTPPISLAGVAAGKAFLKFDSSWRPECCDDNASLDNDQTATVTISYNGGPETEVMHSIGSKAFC